MTITHIKKQTFQWAAYEDGSTETPNLTSTGQARDIIFTDAATSYHNNSTSSIQTQWILVNNKTLKVTVTYGCVDNLTQRWEVGIQALESAQNYYKNNFKYICTELTQESDHLF